MLKGVRGIAFVRFTSADVVRHPLVQKIIDAYERDAEVAGIAQPAPAVRRAARASLRGAQPSQPRARVQCGVARDVSAAPATLRRWARGARARRRASRCASSTAAKAAR